MPSLLYIHGFLSSPQSHKAVQVKRWLQQHCPTIQFLCPALSPYPDEAKQVLLSTLATAETPIGLMGSSLGGFWATWLAEQFNLPAVLINPSVNPMAMFPTYINQSIKNFHTDEHYVLRDVHLAQLRDADTPVITRVNNYWLLAQTGDEVLDYQLAVDKYAGAKQTIEQGGDHAFQGFDRHLDAAIAFLFKTPL